MRRIIAQKGLSRDNLHSNDIGTITIVFDLKKNSTEKHTFLSGETFEGLLT